MSLEDDDTVRAKANLGRVLSGKWTLEKVIGVGGMAAVYAAAHRTGSRAAVKMLHPDLARHDEVRARFLREAYIANTVAHEGVVTVIDDDVDEHGIPYLVMELLTGQSVASLVHRAGGRLPLADVLRMADASLAVLEAAHGKQIVHRDLKPDNLFMTDRGVLKVLDFGIARLRDGKTNRTKTGLLMGTPSFMAPEQALGRTSDIDGSTDQWALGATIFTLLSGRHVHEAETDNELIIYAATRPARSLASVVPDAPSELVAAVDRSLSYDRVKRFPDATAMRAALAPVLASVTSGRTGGVSSATAPGISPGIVPGTPTGQQTSRRPTGAPSAMGTGRRPSVRPGTAPGTSGGTDRHDPNHTLTADEAFGDNIAGAKDLFQKFEKALTTKHQYGANHPESARRFDALFQKATEELGKSDAGLAVNVNPYSFYVGSETLWEPKPPLDQIPYRLFADGIRLIAFLPGLGDHELSTFLKILTSDPAKDIPNGENLLTMIWDAAFEHIQCEEVDSFTDGDQAARQKFEQDRNKIMALARFDTGEQLLAAWKSRSNEARSSGGVKQQALMNKLSARLAAGEEDSARAATMRTFAGDRKNVAPGSVSLGEALRVDDATRATLAARFKADMGAVGERFVVAAGNAFLFAARQGKPQAATAPLKLAIDGLAKEAPPDAVEFVSALCRAVETNNPAETEALRASFAGLLVGPEAMKRLLEHAAAPGGAQGDFARGLAVIMGYVDATHLPTVLDALAAFPNTPLLDVFLKYVARVAPDHEDEIGALLAVAETDLALALLRILAAMGTHAAKQNITLANKNPNAVVRIEAIGHLEGVSSEKLRLELRRLIEDAETGVRQATLVSMAKYKIKIAGPFLVLRVRSPAFTQLPIEERRQALATLVELAPARAEAVAIDLLAEKGGVSRFVSNEGVTQTKLLAIETLDAAGSSSEAAEALTALTRGGFFSNDKLKERAMLALRAVLARQAQPAPAASPTQSGHKR